MNGEIIAVSIHNNIAYHPRRLTGYNKCSTCEHEDRNGQCSHPNEGKKGFYDKPIEKCYSRSKKINFNLTRAVN